MKILWESEATWIFPDLRPEDEVKPDVRAFILRVGDAGLEKTPENERKVIQLASEMRRG